ncbi:MAG: arylesterase [Saprospiraceae bacterium]|nr:arylesterase [Saprospiraceae bacterium]
MRNSGYLFLISFIYLLSACQPKQESVQQVDADADNKDKNSQTVYQESEKNDVRYILFYGNSLTAGYGLDEDKAFPALIQKRIDSLNLKYTVINAGLSGETTSGGLNRITWVLKQKVDVFVLELGANDVLRGLDLKETESNLSAIIDKVLESNPNTKIILAGMQAPPNMGTEYTRTFASIFPKLAKKYNAALIPFLLEDVASIPALNLADGKHPNEEGQKIVCENVWRVLEQVL